MRIDITAWGPHGGGSMPAVKTRAWTHLTGGQAAGQGPSGGRQAMRSARGGRRVGGPRRACGYSRPQAGPPPASLAAARRSAGSAPTPAPGSTPASSTGSTHSRPSRAPSPACADSRSGRSRGRATAALQEGPESPVIRRERVAEAQTGAPSCSGELPMCVRAAAEDQGQRHAEGYRGSTRPQGKQHDAGGLPAFEHASSTHCKHPLM